MTAGTTSYHLLPQLPELRRQLDLRRLCHLVPAGGSASSTSPDAGQQLPRFGTGFLISADVIRENGGWPYHLLTEDIEFSVSCALKGRRIGYCDKAVIYDEQPTVFRQSWDQRLRWSIASIRSTPITAATWSAASAKAQPEELVLLRYVHMTGPRMLLTLVTIAFNLVVCAGDSPPIL